MAANYEEEFNEIAGLFRHEWNQATPVAWPNVNYTPTTGTPWVRFTMLPAASIQASIGSPGSNCYRYPGIIDVQIFTPLNGGDIRASKLADKVVSIFHEAELDNFRFSEGYVVNVNSADSGWHQKNVRVKFWRDSFK